jgi:Rrf2 family protein
MFGFPVYLSRAAHFALRTVLDLTVEGPSHTAAVAARQGIPLAQAGKIVQTLARAGLVRTGRGAGGGVRLARAPEALTLREVVEAMEGPLVVNRCVAWDDCPCSLPCPVRTTLAHLQREVERVLDSVTVADLARPRRLHDGRTGPALADPGREELA